MDRDTSMMMRDVFLKTPLGQEYQVIMYLNENLLPVIHAVYDKQGLEMDQRFHELILSAYSRELFALYMEALNKN